ncbi:sporulation protein YabP [Papillibacter cinnamivorans]|uniref:Sporulation protein YqfC/sporulation protein YabP,TIGR02892 n=1 Tax=Papillibacter cinnamivorans DSM 12816 TaxID=1122930 RepID=A0A1W2A247_9FIRM|nr:sporulation protein YabP [Papillibacter cinnamivorans]SMC54734.1 sporulation protein YqfC/sporulation protein YabP,TIGR02892 [Papillibacter cinnamivorans DSM 12816]
MAYEEKIQRNGLVHHIVMEGREHLSVSGVEDVESFDETGIVMITSQGTLVVRGNELRIGKLNLEGGELSVEGTIDSLTYEEDLRERGGLFSRLFR